MRIELSQTFSQVRASLTRLLSMVRKRPPGALHTATFAGFSRDLRVRRLLEIDSTTTTAHFAAQTVPVIGSSLPATRLLTILGEGYRKKQLPNSPQLDRSAITIVDSSTSFLVQAADVLGNFSMNYVIRNLGPTTAGRAKKAEIFENVFHDILAQDELCKTGFAERY